MPLLVNFPRRLRNWLIFSILILYINIIPFPIAFIFSIFYLMILITDADENRMGLTFDEYLEEIWDDYSSQIKGGIDLQEHMFLKDEQLRIHIRENPSEVNIWRKQVEESKIQNYKDKRAPDKTHEEMVKEGNYDPEFIEFDDDEYEFNSEHGANAEAIVEGCVDFWEQNEHETHPENALSYDKIMELMYEKKMNKQIVTSLKNQLIKKQLNTVILDKQYNSKLKKYRQNKQYKKSTLLMSSSLLKVEPESINNKDKIIKSKNVLFKQIKSKTSINLFKNNIKIHSKKYIIKNFFEMNEYEYNKNKLIQKMRFKYFVPGKYSDKNGEIIRSKIFSNIDINPPKFEKPFEVAPKGILGPEWIKAPKAWKLEDLYKGVNKKNYQKY